jgi:hypothetical protein
MQVIKCLPAVTTFPTGDKSFAVQQGFPQVKSDTFIISISLFVISHTFCLKNLITLQPISAEEADPFLMCDHFVRASVFRPLFSLLRKLVMGGK